MVYRSGIVIKVVVRILASICEETFRIPARLAIFWQGKFSLYRRIIIDGRVDEGAVSTEVALVDKPTSTNIVGVRRRGSPRADLWFIRRQAG